MIRGIYSAAAAMNAAAENQEVIAHNIAHATVPGFRQRGVAFALPEPATTGPQSPGNLTSGRTTSRYVDFRSGPMQSTGEPLDLAIEGNSFFTLAGPGGPLYSRNGVFHRNAQGQIVNVAGYALLGADGPITLPPDAGQINIAHDGAVSADGRPIGKIQLASFADLSQLEPVGPTLFRAGSKAGLQNGSGNVRQGYRESSNVQPAEAMVAMIAGARHFEASQRALRAIADSVQLNTRPS